MIIDDGAMKAGTTTVLNATLNLGNIVSGVFTRVLAKHTTHPLVKQLSFYCDKRRPPIP